MADNDEITFGFRGFWPTAHSAFPRFWDVSSHLIESINSLISPGYPRTNGLQKVVLNLGILCATSFAEINTLVGNGLGQGAMKITRSMLETAINAAFLYKFPEYLDDYLDWGAIESYRLLNYIRTDAPHLLSDYSKEMQVEIDADCGHVSSTYRTHIFDSGRRRIDRYGTRGPQRRRQLPGMCCDRSLGRRPQSPIATIELQPHFGVSYKQSRSEETAKACQPTRNYF